MKTLAHCLATNPVDPHYRKVMKAMSDAYFAQSNDRLDADMKAAEDLMNDLQIERADIVRQITEQGGVVEEPVAEKPAEEEAPPVVEAPAEKPVSEARAAYDKANDKATAATQAFNKVRDGFRAKKVGVDRFVDAQLEHDIALAEFDAADAAYKSGKVADPTGDANPALVVLASRFPKIDRGTIKDALDAGIPATEIREMLSGKTPARGGAALVKAVEAKYDAKDQAERNAPVAVWRRMPHNERLSVLDQAGLSPRLAGMPFDAIGEVGQRKIAKIIAPIEDEPAAPPKSKGKPPESQQDASRREAEENWDRISNVGAENLDAEKLVDVERAANFGHNILATAYLRQLSPQQFDAITREVDFLKRYLKQRRAAPPIKSKGKKKPDAGVQTSEQVDVAPGTDTPAFKRWFGDSKVVDADGKPLVVMHASTFGDITKFDRSKQAFGKAGFGFYFSDADGSNLFAEYGDKFQAWRSADGEPKAIKTYPVYLSMQNPLVVDHVDDLKPYLEKDQKFGVGRGIFGNLPADVITKLERAGYDGIITRETTAPKVHKTRGLSILERDDPKAKSFPVYVAFRPEQIKSSIGNNGNYDPSNPDIREARNKPNPDQTDMFQNAPPKPKPAITGGRKENYDPSDAEAAKVQAGIEGKSMIEVADWLSVNAPPQLAVVAFKVGQQLKRLAAAGVKQGFRVAHLGDLVPSMLNNARGITQLDYNNGTSTIWINGHDIYGKVGTSYRTVLHELVHAATMNAIRLGNKANATGELRDATDALYKVAHAVANHYKGRKTLPADQLHPFEQRILNGQVNAIDNVDEVLTWALTDADMQAYLETIPYKDGKSMWTRFVEVIRSLMGLEAKSDTALAELLKVGERLLQVDIDSMRGLSEVRMQQLADVSKAAKSSTTAPAAAPAAGDDAGGEPAMAVQNDSQAKVRESHNLPPVDDHIAVGDQELWEDSRPDAVDGWQEHEDLFRELLNHPRELSALEVFQLLRLQIRNQNRVREIEDQIIDAHTTGDQAQIVNLQVQQAAVIDMIDELSHVMDAAGTEQGRALRARQVLATMDYTIAGLRRKARAAINGGELNSQQGAAVNETDKDIREIQRQMELLEPTDASEEAHKQLEMEVGSQDPNDPENQKGARQKRGQRARKSLAQAIADGDDPKEYGNLIQQLAKSLYELGMREREQLIQGVHTVLKGLGSKMTEREVMDAISGYGLFKRATEDELKVGLSQLKGEMLQDAKIKDMLAGKAPQATGKGRIPPSDEHRRLTRIVNELKRRFNIQATDPATALKSSMDAIKTRLRNQIRDYENAIANNKALDNTKTPPLTDAQIKALREQLAEVKGQYDEMFPKDTTLTDEQRAKIAERALERSIADIERLIKSKGVKPDIGPSSPPSTPAIEALRVRRKALQAELEEVQANNEALQNEKELAKLTKRLAELDEQIKTGAKQAAPKPGEQPTNSAHIQNLRAERDALTEKVKELRETDPATREQNMLRAIHESMTEAYRRLTEGDLAPKQAEAFNTPAIEAAKAAKANILQALKDAQEEAGVFDAQRIAKAMESVEASIAELQRRIAEGDLHKPHDGSKIPTDPVLEARKAYRAALQKTLQKMRQAAKPKLTPEERANKALTTRMTNEIRRLQERIVNKDFETRVKLKTNLSEKNQQLRRDLDKKKKEFHEKMMQWKVDNWNTSQKVWHYAKEGYGLFRALQTMLDLSATARQGMFFLVSNPVRTVKTIPETWAAMFDEDKAVNSTEAILNRPNARNGNYKKAGLYIAERGAKLSSHEEVYANRLIEKIPGPAGRLIAAAYRGSERSYTVFLNRMRADAFDALLATLPLTEQATDAELKGLGYLVNNATGRGSVLGYGQDGGVASTIFYSPRYLTSRFAMLTGLPLAKAGSDRMRKLVAKQYLKTAMGLTLIYMLRALAADDDEEAFGKDITSSDFLKLRFGEARVDPLAGLSQVMVFLGRNATDLMGGKGFTTISGNHRDLKGRDNLSFLRSKLAPVPGLLASFLFFDKKDFAGKKLWTENHAADVAKIAYSMSTPLSLQTILDVGMSDGVGKAAALDALSFMGVGVNDYTKDKKGAGDKLYNFVSEMTGGE